MSSNIPNQRLTVNFGSGATHYLVDSGPPKSGNPLFDARRLVENINPRIPWDLVEKSYDYNYHLTISPDHKRYDGNHNDRKVMCEILRKWILTMKEKKLIKKFICVYEYGKHGKEYGHLHFHILLLSHKCNILKDEANAEFGTTSIRKKYTTRMTRIKINPLFDQSTPQEKLSDYKKQIDYIYTNYLQKESHNKVKCLFTDQKKKDL